MKDKKEDKIKLELSVSEINIILEGLSSLPFKNVYKLIENIHLQSTSNKTKK